MVSFTDHYPFNTLCSLKGYDAISTDRLPSETKIGKVSWYFNNSLLCKSEFLSATKIFLFYVQALFSKWLVGIHQISF